MQEKEEKKEEEYQFSVKFKKNAPYGHKFQLIAEDKKTKEIVEKLKDVFVNNNEYSDWSFSNGKITIYI